MKFGHNLPRNQVPEWAASYINYKGLKKLIKTAADTSKDGSAPDLAGKHHHFKEACRVESGDMSTSTCYR
jgi:SPX domain protein involved in polyphosphate accumulation